MKRERGFIIKDSGSNESAYRYEWTNIDNIDDDEEDSDDDDENDDDKNSKNKYLEKIMK